VKKARMSEWLFCFHPIHPVHPRSFLFLARMNRMDRMKTENSLTIWNLILDFSQLAEMA